MRTRAQWLSSNFIAALNQHILRDANIDSQFERRPDAQLACLIYNKMGMGDRTLFPNFLSSHVS